MRKNTILFLLSLLIMGSVTQAKTQLVKDPMKYSATFSKLYAEGDSNNSDGWQGCEYIAPDSVDGTSIQIQCFGEREILVHGGFMKSESFTCEFKFAETVLLSEICY